MPHFVSTPTTASRLTPARRPILSRAVRRGIRQAAALADELHMHSFRVHGDGTITWTFKHEKTMQKPEHKCQGEMTQRVPSNRTLRSRARAAEHAALVRKAQDFSARRIFGSGAQALRAR